MRALGILIGLSRMMEGNYAELSLMIDNFPRKEAEKNSYLNTKDSIHTQNYDKRALVRSIGISRKRM